MASTRSIKTYGGRRRKKLPSPPHPLLDREDFLDPEHESVEPVDPDNNNDDDDYRQDNEEDPIYDEDEDMGPVTRRRARLRPEVQDADEHLRNPQLRRLKRNKHIDWDEDDEDQEFAEAETPGPRTETSTLADIEQALAINGAYLKTLREMATYYRGRRLDDDPDLKRVEQAMAHTLGIMSDLMPVAQTDPVEHVVAPAVPEADGSEKRFTDVAAQLGIKWSLVSEQDKSAVYDRALELHVEQYGARPRKVRMWTKEGYQPVYYYNEATYRGTMRRALREFQEEHQM
jgi:hypothetical protein